MKKATPVAASVDLIPSIKSAKDAHIEVSASMPTGPGCVGVLVPDSGPVPPSLGLDRQALSDLGFEGKPGQALVVPNTNGHIRIAIGTGRDAELNASDLRDAASVFARASEKHTHLFMDLADVKKIPADVAAQAIVEGVLLARYRYDALKQKPSASGPVELTLISDRAAEASEGSKRGQIMANATQLSRDLANAPPSELTATRMANIAADIAAETGLGIEVFDKDALLKLGCGGLLGVNRGSVDPPRMIKLTYKPKNGKTNGHLILAGKGIMYDSGGIALKPADATHAAMKLDMSGAAAILAAMSTLKALDCQTAVTGFLMCTDNMPSGSAMKLGDVLKQRGGKTVEVNNTDAEGRLVLADALVLATEEKPDAIVDIATLTGACLRALGTQMAGVLGNRQDFVDQVVAAADRTDERVWQLPLEKRYRRELDSEVADLRNLGGENAATIVAALFLAEFVGDVPWTHIDMCGPMKTDVDDFWRSKGATGYGTRLLSDLACNFTRPSMPA